MSAKHQYVVEYDDPGNPGFAPAFWTTSAYNLEHALDRFNDSDEGFRALRIARKTERPKHRWHWVQV